MTASGSAPIDGATSAALLALSAVTLGAALQVSDGMFDATAMGLLTVSLACAGAGTLWTAWDRGTRIEGALRRWLPWLLAGAVIVQLAQLGWRPHLVREGRGWPPPWAFDVALVAVAALVTGGAAGWRGLRRAWFPVVLGVYAALAVWVILSTPRPHIDVFQFQRYGSAVLWQGENPYAFRFPDIYGSAQGFYGEGLSHDGWLTFGFPYFPLSLLLVLPAHVLTGDYRFAHAAAALGSAVLMAASRPGFRASGAACLYLFTPRMFFILQQGWTEPLVVLLIAATVWTARRWPRGAPYAYGLLLAIKQYSILVVPLAVPLARVARLRLPTLLVPAFALAAAITVPFLLWDPRAFVESVVTLQLYQPFRTDALSYLAWVRALGGPLLPGGTAFLAAAVALALVFRRAAQTAAGTAAGIALTYFAFFAFNKQAFANYYLLVIGTLLVAVAASGDDADAPGAARGSGDPPVVTDRIASA